MFVPETLKLNKFIDAKLPKNKDYFARIGKVAPAPGQFTGDNSAMMPTDKISQISQAEYDLYDEMMQAEENAKSDG